MISAANHVPLSPLSFLARARRAFPAKVAVVDDDETAHEIASEAFTRLRDALRRGTGPQEALRPYLLTAVRRVARERIDAGRADAGRTDAGVHARGQIAAARLPRPFDPAELAAGRLARGVRVETLLTQLGGAHFQVDLHLFAQLAVPLSLREKRCQTFP